VSGRKQRLGVPVQIEGENPAPIACGREKSSTGHLSRALAGEAPGAFNWVRLLWNDGQRV
jgi:hypothetical protein